MMDSGYQAIYDGWKADPELFWSKAAQSIDWFTPYDRVFEPDSGAYGRWFAGATTNTCYNWQG